MESRITVTVLSEDSEKWGHPVVRKFAERIAKTINPRCATHRIKYEPTPTGLVRTAVLANKWRSTAQNDHAAIVELRQFLATKLSQPNCLVFFHFDADVTWARRDQCATRRQFANSVVEPVVKTLASHGRTQSQIAESMAKLVEVVPYYSIEAWTYHNTEELVRICRERCAASYHHEHAATYHSWATAPDQLEEISMIKRQACVTNTTNLQLVEQRFPWTQLEQVGKSFHATVAGAKTPSVIKILQSISN